MKEGELNVSKPVWSSDKWKRKNEENLVYYPNKISYDKKDEKGKQEGGLSKKQILKLSDLPEEELQEDENKDKKLVFKGWDMIMLEQELTIPRKEQGQEIGDRKQIEVGKSGQEYLEQMKNSKEPYENERPLTIENELILGLMVLEKENKLIDDIGKNGKGPQSANWCLGTFDSSSGLVPVVGFGRNFNRVYLNSYFPRNQFEDSGFRAGVLVVSGG